MGTTAGRPRHGRGSAVVTALFFLVMGGFFIHLGLPGDGPVMCGHQQMQPGDYCHDAGSQPVTYNDEPPPSNYDTYAREQHAATPSAIVGGVVLGTVGLLILGAAWVTRTRDDATP